MIPRATSRPRQYSPRTSRAVASQRHRFGTGGVRRSHRARTRPTRRGEAPRRGRCPIQASTARPDLRRRGGTPDPKAVDATESVEHISPGPGRTHRHAAGDVPPIPIRPTANQAEARTRADHEPVESSVTVERDSASHVTPHWRRRDSTRVGIRHHRRWVDELEVGSVEALQPVQVVVVPATVRGAGDEPRGAVVGDDPAVTLQRPQDHA